MLRSACPHYSRCFCLPRARSLPRRTSLVAIIICSSPPGGAGYRKMDRGAGIALYSRLIID